VGDARLIDVFVDTTAPLGFGTLPGAALFVSNPGPDDTLFQRSAAPLVGSGLTAGYTDSLVERCIASGTGEDGTTDIGASTFSGSEIMRENPVDGFGPRSLGSVSLPCFDVDLDFISTTSGFHCHASAVTLGNRMKSKVAAFLLNATTGNQSVTGVGFRPDLVVFLGCGAFSPGTGDHDDFGTNFVLGVMDGSGNQWAPAYRSRFFSSPTVRSRQFRNDACINHIGESGSAIPTTAQQTAHFVSMDADGFTIDLTAAGLTSTGFQMAVNFLAIKINPGQGSVACGWGTQGDASLTAGFRPDVLFFGSAMTADTAVHTDAALLDFGASDGTIHRSYWEGGASGGASWSYTSTVSCIRMAAGGGVVVGEATAAMTGTGASLTWSTDDGGLRLFGWIAFQTSSDPIGAPVAVTDPATTIGPTAATLNGTITPNDPGVIDYFFQYGTTAFYGTDTMTLPDGTGFGPGPIAQFVTGLAPGTTYHFRVVATDGGSCFIYGADVTFTTTAVTPNLLVFRNRFRGEA
jgi:hypothetical protein